MRAMLAIRIFKRSWNYSSQLHKKLFHQAQKRHLKDGVKGVRLAVNRPEQQANPPAWKSVRLQK
jgi:hypothetical protein